MKHLLYLMLITLSLISSPAIASSTTTEKSYGEQLIERMTLEEIVGQLFIVDLARLQDNEVVTELSENTSQKLSRYKFGGVILFAHNIIAEEQLTTLIKDIQSTEKIPMFICVDEEGGRVSRLQHTEALELERTPSADVIGERNSLAYSYNIGAIIAKQVKKYGFNVDFAPVCDINTNPENTVIGARSFGNTPETVSRMAVAMIRGLQDNGVMSSAKHFPGHGDTSTDTHYALASLDHDLTRLRNEELVPFQAAIDNGVQSIMLAHIVTPNITGNHLPATMSKVIVEDLLRKEMGFHGLVITDAMMMKAITDNFSSSEVCIGAIKAGVDVLLMPNNISEGYNAVLDLAKNDKNFKVKVIRAATRILNTKDRLGIL